MGQVGDGLNQFKSPATTSDFNFAEGQPHRGGDHAGSEAAGRGHRRRGGDSDLCVCAVLARDEMGSVKVSARFEVPYVIGYSPYRFQ